jgi:hypothetical protein
MLRSGSVGNEDGAHPVGKHSNALNAACPVVSSAVRVGLIANTACKRPRACCVEGHGVAMMWTHLNFGPWTLDFGLRTLDFGLWTSDFGLRTLDFGLRPRQAGHRCPAAERNHPADQVDSGGIKHPTAELIAWNPLYYQPRSAQISLFLRCLFGFAR